jgi:hypothetical protein
MPARADAHGSREKMSSPNRRSQTLTESTAAVESLTGAITVYRRHNKPALGPFGDSLEDLA